MSWLSNIGHTIGGVLSNPLVDAGLGVLTGGATIPLLAGGIGSLIKPGGNIGKGLTGAATGGLAGAGGSALGGALKIGTPLSGIANTVGGLPGVGTAQRVLSNPLTRTVATGAAGGGAPAGGSSGGILGALQGLLGGAGGMIGGAAKGLLQNPLYGLAGLEGVNAALLQKQATDYAKQARGDVVNSYTERAPLRTGGLAGMQNALASNIYSGLKPPPMATA